MLRFSALFGIDVFFFRGITGPKSRDKVSKSLYQTREVRARGARRRGTDLAIIAQCAHLARGRRYTQFR